MPDFICLLYVSPSRDSVQLVHNALKETYTYQKQGSKRSLLALGQRKRKKLTELAVGVGELKVGVEPRVGAAKRKQLLQ